MKDDEATDRFRVSVRELREVTWRALLADGITSGEAMTAAEAVTFAEIQLAAGLDAAANELGRAGRAGRAGAPPCTRETGQRYDTIHDPAGRGPLLLAPLVIGLVAATPTSSPILMPAMGWQPTIAALLARFSRSEGATLFAHTISVGPTAAVPVGAVGFPDGSLTLLDGRADDLIPTLDIVETEAGVMVGRCRPDHDLSSVSRSHPSDVVRTAERLARRDGVDVDDTTWQSVKAAAGRFLVPET